jgi:two-component system, cell cycle sensor histidine kinase and response regulator CckA
VTVNFRPRAADTPLMDSARLDAPPRSRPNQEQALADLSLLALTEADLDALFQTTTECARSVLDADFASLHELQPDGVTLLLRAGAGWDPSEQVIGSELDSNSPATRALHANGPILVEQLAGGPRCPADSVLALHGVTSSAAMIIRGEDRPFGVVSVHSRESNAFSSEDVFFLRSLANTLAAAVARSAPDALARELASIVETSLDAIVGRALDGAVTSWNAAAERLFGYSAEEMIGRRIDILAPADRRDELDDVNARLKRGENVETFETIRVRKDGTLVDVASTVSPIRNASGTVVAASAISRDITVQKAAQAEMERLLAVEREALAAAQDADAALRKSAEQYRRLFENNPTPMWLFDPETLLFTAVNDAAVANYGYSREEFLAMSVEDIRPTEEVARLHAALADWRANPTESKTWAETWCHRKKDGTLVDVVISSHSTEFEGRPARVVLATDVTERVRSEQALRESEARHRDLFENANDLIAIVDLDSCLADVNTAFARTLGYSREELIGTSLDDLVPPEWHDRLKHANDSKLSRRRRSTVYEHELTAKDGRRIAVEAASRLIEKDGRPVGTQVICRDITERRIAARALRESEELYRLVVENSMDMIAIFDLDARPLYLSPSHADVLGYPPTELLRQSVAEMVHPDDRALATSAFAAARRGSRACPARPLRLLHKEGHYIHTEGAATPILDDNGNPRLVLATYRDITDRVLAEELSDQLRQSQKMEAIGSLAGGIAHDFNNLLTVISGYSEIALARNNRSEIHKAVEEVAAAAKSAAALTAQLLVFSRRQVALLEVVDVGALVESTERLLRRLLGEDIALEASIASGLRPIRVDPSQIEQVLLNLAVNARDAMPDGGKLSIEAENAEVGEAYAASHLGIDPGNYVAISVRDTGCGMNEQTLARAFEPFFTTKGEGTGLGLATVHGIVMQSGGYIEVDSEPGAGTTFQLLFPVAEAPRSESGAESEAADASGHSAPATILVVEDEEAVRRLTAHILATEGYAVIEAATSDEAIKVASDWTESLHLIVSDVRLPGRRGPELADELRTVHPEARLLFTSGYAEGELVADDPGRPFLAKPFTAAGLASKVREILAA